MEEFVQLSLNTYDNMRETINKYSKENATLKQDLKDEQEDKQRIIAKAEIITEKYKGYILSRNLRRYYFDTKSLEELTNYDGWHFAIEEEKVLIELGITKEEMIEFIKEAYAKWKEEEKD